MEAATCPCCVRLKTSVPANDGCDPPMEALMAALTLAVTDSANLCYGRAAVSIRSNLGRPTPVENRYTCQ